jgi:hypothetical protein
MACYFKNQYGFPTTQNASPGICGHNDMPGTSTPCPGPLPWVNWFSYFNSACTASSPPANDNCTGATLLTSSTSCNYLNNQTVNNATASGKPKGSCDVYTGTPALADVWYKFQAQATSHTITVDPNGSALDAVIVAYSSCTNNTEVGCSDTQGGNGTISTLNLTGLTIGNNYYIRVYDYGLQTTNGGFRICVTHSATTCPDNFETNDNCSTATNVFASPLGNGTSNYTLNANIGYAGDQDWYKVNLAACGTLTVNLSNLPFNYDLELYAVGATCTSNIIAGSYNNGTSNEQIVYNRTSSAPVTIYAKVYPFNSSTFTTASCYNLNFQWVSSSITPGISISANPSGAICAGQSVTFTATPSTGGTSPSYQWKVGTTNVGTNSPTYTTSALTNGQLVTCVLTSSSSCASPTTATSNAITMTVSSSVTPSVSISANPSGAICAGQSVTFTATPTNGGTTPNYQWKVGTTIVGTNSPTYTTSSLTNGQVVTCVLTSSSTCASPATATSNAITMTVNASVTPSVSVSANPSGAICAGQSVTFTATPTNEGTSPSYQWKVGTTNVGTNSLTYTTSALTNGQVVTCVLTSSLACASPATATSNAITMTVSSSVTPSVSISANPSGAICASQSVTFTATPTSGGTTPGYQWKVGATNVGTNTPTYTTSALTNGQLVTCIMTSSLACASPTTATSNSITMSLNNSLSPTITISQVSCTGNSVSFNSTITNGGSSPTYLWTFTGMGTPASGTNGAALTLDNATNGTIVQCTLISNAVCANPSQVPSAQLLINCITTGVPNINGLEEFKIIPNPNNGIFTIRLKLNTIKEVKFRIFNLMTQLVYESEKYQLFGQQHKLIDGSKWPAGVYLLETKIGKETFMQKIIVIR